MTPMPRSDMHSFSPIFRAFAASAGLYLDDIYVKTEYRGKGVGEALLKEMARLAAARGPRTDRFSGPRLEYTGGPLLRQAGSRERPRGAAL